MAGSRKPNPTHITRFERESFRQGRTVPERWSHYDHGINVPADYLDDITLKGFVVIEQTHADQWGDTLDRMDDDENLESRYDRKHVERMAGDTGLAERKTYTVGHIVWPGEEDKVCMNCPYGSGEFDADEANIELST